MKKLTIILLALFFVGITNINAQTEATISEEVVSIEEIQEANKDCPFTKTTDGKLICTKTGKICDPASCKNKSKCCKGKSKKSSCSKSKKTGFNYGQTNNYGSKLKSKCSAKKTKESSPEPATEEEVPSEE